MSTLNFEELNLHNETVNALRKHNETEATPLQQTILKSITDERNLIVKTETSEEKYTAFAAAACEVLQQAGHDSTAVLIITDATTAAQAISRRVEQFCADFGSCICVDDAGNADEQPRQLQNEPAVIVATPSSLQELLKSQRFIFRNIGLLILDELDTMLEHGQKEHLKRIKRRVLSDYTGCICTQTYDAKTQQIAAVFVDDPVISGFGYIQNAPAGPPPPVGRHLKQSYINVPYHMKISTLLAHLNQTQSSDSCVIFTASKRGTDRLYKALKKQGKKATSLHGKLSDEKRARRLSNFMEGNVQYLLVADISAGSLNLDGLHRVINYDVPNSSDEYRFRAALLDGADSAQLVSLVSKQDRSDISGLQNELGQTPQEIPLPNEVKQKLKNRKRKKQSNGKGKKEEDLHLPQPSYDKLSGGRSGNHDKEKTGVVQFFKKLFT